MSDAGAQKSEQQSDAGAQKSEQQSDAGSGMDLYKDYRIEVIKAKRAINSKADKRGDVDEVLVMNFEQQ
jgi:site-specific DNA-adenine methylase